MSFLELIPGGSRWLAIQKIAKAGLDDRLLATYQFKYAKIKGNLLVFCFSHPLVKQEFKLQEEMILNRLRVYWKLHVKTLKLNNITFAHIHAMSIKEKEKIDRLPDALFYKERSKGEFINKATNPILKGMFEDIRKSIKGQKV
ncbi:MAG: hypothetical protein ACK5LP_07785 [Campylobacteraceae bacterium]